MRRMLSVLKPSPALAVALAALLAACGGLAVAATSSKPALIRACANKKTGALRLANKCRKKERSISWNKEGVPGLRGLTGATGATGAAGAAGATGGTGNEGKEGPRGPGAISFDTTIPEGEATLAGPIDGIVVKAVCHATNTKDKAVVAVEAASGKNNVQVSGTGYSANGTTVEHVDVKKGTAAVKISPEAADLDVVAADSTIGKMVRVDVHAEELGEPTCPVWGMVIPSG